MNIHDSAIKEEYINYCNDDDNLIDNHNHSLQTFNNIMRELEKSSYSIKKGAIVINQYNCIMDGVHRCSYLLARYGPDYKIEVVKLYTKTSRRLIFLSPLFELMYYVKLIKKRFSKE